MRRFELCPGCSDYYSLSLLVIVTRLRWHGDAARLLRLKDDKNSAPLRSSLPGGHGPPGGPLFFLIRLGGGTAESRGSDLTEHRLYMDAGFTSHGPSFARSEPWLLV